ncbi:uncharacterized protein LOC144707483 [Wolffia australiana]
MAEEGSWTKAVDRWLLLPFFLLLAMAVPLVDAQSCLPSRLFPAPLLRLRRGYALLFDDYLLLHHPPPPFFLPLVWIELLAIWPLSLASAYAIARGGRPWLPPVCLATGASVATSMAAILGEIIGSGRGSNKLLLVYAPFAVFAVVLILRGLFPCPSSPTKKKAM